MKIMSKYEREGNAPEGWRTDVILQRSTNGTVQEVEVEDADDKAQ